MALEAGGAVFDLSDPFPFYAHLRAQPGIVRATSGQWLVARYADAAAVLTSDRFAHWQLPVARTPFERSINRWTSLVDPRSGSALRHDLVRLVDATRLSTVAAAAAERIAATLGSSFDAIADFARPYTLAVAAEVLRIPEEDRDRFIELVTHTRPVFAAAFDGAGPSAARLARYLVDHLHRIAPSWSDSDDELLAFSLLLLFAAHDNMVNFIGNAWLALLRDRNAFERLKHEPRLMNTAVDELLRFDSPVQFISLTAREPADLAGERIESGDVVWVAVASANRDPVVFDGADRLRLDRSDNPHLSFGVGATKCIGVHLARIEGRHALEVLLRLRDPELTHDVAYRSDTGVSRSIDRLLICARPTPNASEFARRYDEHMTSGLMREYYDGSAFFNTGYWTPSAATVNAAGERLMTEVCAPLPAKLETIADIGCGSGGTTESLQRRYPAARVLASNVSIRQLVDCRTSGRALLAACMDAADLALRDSAFDCIAAVESPLHFESRVRFFRNAARALRPGGWLVLSDILFRDSSVVSTWLFPSAEQPLDAAAYAALFDAAEWQAVRVIDATIPCWMGFCNRWDEWTASLHANGDIDDATRDFHRALVETWRTRAGAQYLIVSAQRRRQ